MRKDSPALKLISNDELRQGGGVQQEHGVGDAGGQMDQPELDSTLHCDNLPAIYWPHCTLYH